MTVYYHMILLWLSGVWSESARNSPQLSLHLFWGSTPILKGQRGNQTPTYWHLRCNLGSVDSTWVELATQLALMFCRKRNAKRSFQCWIWIQQTCWTTKKVISTFGWKEIVQKKESGPRPPCQGHQSKGATIASLSELHSPPKPNASNASRCWGTPSVIWDIAINSYAPCPCWSNWSLYECLPPHPVRDNVNAIPKARSKSRIL